MADDPIATLVEEFHRTLSRLRLLLLGDGEFERGIARTEEARSASQRHLRRLSDAFDAVVEESRLATEAAETQERNLDEELQARAASTAKRPASASGSNAPKRTTRSKSRASRKSRGS